MVKPAPQPTKQRSWRGPVLAVVGLLVALGLVLAFDAYRSRPRELTMGAATRTMAKPHSVVNVRAEPASRSIDSYRGQGAWVDVFDSVEAYAGATPPITPAVVDEMAAAGVQTLYLQAARLDERTPEGLVDPWLLAEFLQRAHGAGIDVVGWYLPKWQTAEDLERIAAVGSFSALGHRFDGVAVDIEWTGDDIDEVTRSDRLVELSAQASDSVEGPLGAIVVPPTLMEVVNEDFWPGFPWNAIADDYEVWLPMSYWSFRSEELGDGYTYHVDSVDRLRRNLGQPDALVHGIGGIGATESPPVDAPEPLASIDEMARFGQALVDSGSVGASMYDWMTMSPGARVAFSDAFDGGPLAALRR